MSDLHPDVDAVLRREREAALLHADCLEALPVLPEGCVDAVVTDPPYDLTQTGRSLQMARSGPAGDYDRLSQPNGRERGFMGLAWDGQGVAFRKETWQAVLRALKPGGYLLAFGSPRTWHRLACALEDAGFEMRDTLMFLHGAGFPKGKGCLKPAWEPVLLCRRPGPRVLPLNIEGCRVGAETITTQAKSRAAPNGAAHGRQWNGCEESTHAGRWPANLVLDEEAARLVDEASGESSEKARVLKRNGKRRMEGWGLAAKSEGVVYGDTGGASRFFFCAKASRAEREAGLDSIEIVAVSCPAWEDQGLKARLRVDTAQSPPKVIAASGVPNSDATAWSMWLFGKPTTGRSLADAKSITGTRTSSTTESKTLSWLLRSRTSAFMVAANGAGPSGGNPAASAKPSTPSLTITSGLPAFPPGAEPAASGMPWTISGNVASPADHPTVKPLALMRWLVRLVSFPGDLVLDPFVGSGTTAVACALEGCRCVGVEREAEYLAIAQRRLAHAERDQRESLFPARGAGGRQLTFEDLEGGGP